MEKLQKESGITISDLKKIINDLPDLDSVGNENLVHLNGFNIGLSKIDKVTQLMVTKKGDLIIL